MSATADELRRMFPGDPLAYPTREEWSAADEFCTRWQLPPVEHRGNRAKMRSQLARRWVKVYT